MTRGGRVERRSICGNRTRTDHGCPAAAWRVASVEVLPKARLRVSFVDGTAGEVDMQRFLQGVELVGTVFEPLRDPRFLAQAAVVSGAVTWPNGADLAPDAMYDAIRAQGVWNLE